MSFTRLYTYVAGLLLLALGLSGCIAGPPASGATASPTSISSTPLATLASTEATSPTTPAPTVASTMPPTALSTTPAPTVASTMPPTPASTAPAPTTTITATQEVASYIALEASYTITGALQPLILAPPQGSPLQAGKRVAFRLAPHSEGISIVNNAQQLRDAVADDAALLYWVARTDERPDPILVSVGIDEPLGALRLDGNTAIAPLVPAERLGEIVPVGADDQLSSPLGGPDTHVTQLVMWLEPPTLARYPIQISALSHVATARDAKDLFSQAYLAVLRRDDGQYRVVVVLPDKRRFGPPHQPDVERCATLTGTDLWTRVLKQWYGCP